MRLGLECIALGLTLLTSCADEPTTAQPAQLAPAQSEALPASPQPAPPVQIEMRNVQLHVDDSIVLAIDRLRGEMISKLPGRPPVFDDGRSYVLKVSSATMAIDMQSLSSLMNRHVFGYEGAPLKDLEVKATGDGRLEQV